MLFGKIRYIFILFTSLLISILFIKFGRLIFRDFFASIRDVIGGRSNSYEEVLRKAKDSALREMEEQAMRMGANAVIGVDLDYETVGQNGSMLMVTASGTAVFIQD